MTTATTQSAPRIALAAIIASATNPRKRFDQAALDELTESIKRHDVIQPILLRPNGKEGMYELVAGERRYRAAKAAGLADIPATVRILTDAEALEIQVIENLQRKDLHELEEAEGYERLLKCTHHDGTKYTVEDIIAKVNRSRSYVFGRLKLCALCPDARKAFYAGEIDASKALLIARIGHHDTQRQALKDIMGGGNYQRDPMSTRQAHEHILRTYMLVLKAAPFDITDEKLLPKAGACGPCPKRTGNQADLFGDVKSADVCTDTKCFDDKRQAHYGKAVKMLEAAGHKVIAGAAAKKLLPHWDSQNEYARNQLQGGYLTLESTTYAVGRSRKVSEILGPDFEPTLIQHPGTGEIVKVATQQAVTAAANKASRKRSAGGGARKASGPRERVRSAQQIFREKLFFEIAKKLPTELGKAELLEVACELVQGGEDILVAAAIFPTKDGKRLDYGACRKMLAVELPKQNVASLSRIILTALLAGAVEATWMKPDPLLAGAKRWRVDPAKVKKAIADEAKEKAAAAKKPPAKAGNKVKPAKRKWPVADFMKPMQPSAALAVIVGDKPLARTEVTSKLWGYIKKHDLQDKTNRRMIKANDALLPIFGGKKQLSMFEMTKFVAKHLTRA